jgi:hypothetical protein
MATAAEIEARMVPVERRRRPLVDALVEIHGFAGAARIMSNHFLVEEWKRCDGPHKCGKNGCGGSPLDVYSETQLNTIRGWVATCLAVAETEQL